jgi:hypothetical protein
MKQIQNKQKSRGKSLPAFGILKSPEKIREQKAAILLPNVCHLSPPMVWCYGFENI